MLIYDPIERAAATNLLSHPYILSVPEATAGNGGGAATAAQSSGSSTLGATAGLVNAAAKAMAPAPTTVLGPAPAAADGTHGEGNAGDDGDGLKERRNDVPATTKVR